MTDFATIYDNYLSKFEYKKTYNLGSIHTGNVKNKTLNYARRKNLSSCRP